jgi:hypothetical protein
LISPTLASKPILKKSTANITNAVSKHYASLSGYLKYRIGSAAKAINLVASSLFATVPLVGPVLGAILLFFGTMATLGLTVYNGIESFFAKVLIELT